MAGANALRPGFSFLSAGKEDEMKTIKTQALFEPLEIEIGDTTVKAAIDVTIDNLLNISNTCTKARQNLDALDVLRQKAKDNNNAEELRRMNKKAAEIIEPAVKAGIGEESYDAIVAACGAGRKISKESCNIVMVQVLMAIIEVIAEQRNEVLGAKAAHYLTEVEDAQTEPNPEL